MSMKETTDLRVQRTLQCIRDALISLMKEQGFDRTTVRDITSRAMINRATFYLHYEDKYALLRSLVDGMLEELKQTMQLPDHFSAQQLQMSTEVPPVSFVRQFEHLAAHAPFYKVMLGPNGVPGFAGRMEQVIQEALFARQALAQPDERRLSLPRELIIRYATSAHIGIMKHWLEHDMPYSADYMAKQLNRLHMLGPTQLSLPME
ncbi:TetR/AcrR family transcriptional regulator [Paenibacillus sp. OAS669]|uniref:TetR/AcrR family transcriptional regulator n=1 Tax=Paenibacillus sp. OAS669 TaxID=2663821 RepID=UPI001789D521|nr:TetR/AcrR family transcriptional regulator [Paenibacillus sp. OAS669]MBE1444082.1 AcrR family transcriptional regulator [Paenibacillus sp. OAS669]